MNYCVESKFLKSNMWTKNKLLFYLKIKKFYYETIIETDEYFLVTVEENNFIYLGNDNDTVKF